MKERIFAENLNERKNAEFTADFESNKKVAKKFMQKM
jgi:ribosomal protein S17E